HRNCNQPGSIPGVGGHLGRSSARGVDISVDELRRGFLYDSTTSTRRNRYVQLWKHGQRSICDSKLYSAGFETADSSVDHEHRGRHFAKLRSEPGQQLRKCKDIGLWQQTSVENHNRRGYPPFEKGGGCPRPHHSSSQLRVCIN